MICPECGANNRDGASYWDSCGKPLSEAARVKTSRSTGLVGWMTVDWTLRGLGAGVAGIVGALIAASQSGWEYVPLFVGISVLGWAFLAYAIRHAP